MGKRRNRESYVPKLDESEQIKLKTALKGAGLSLRTASESAKTFTPGLLFRINKGMTGIYPSVAQSLYELLNGKGDIEFLKKYMSGVSPQDMATYRKDERDTAWEEIYQKHESQLRGVYRASSNENKAKIISVLENLVKDHEKLD